MYRKAHHKLCNPIRVGIFPFLPSHWHDYIDKENS